MEAHIVGLHQASDRGQRNSSHRLGTHSASSPRTGGQSGGARVVSCLIKSAKKTHLLEQAAFLNDVSDRFHLYTLRLVDVLECVQVSSLLVLNYSDLVG